METISRDIETSYLKVTKLGVQNTLYPKWVIDKKIQQRKRRALITAIFLAYPYFAW
jgi:hypothetical protein